MKWNALKTLRDTVIFLPILEIRVDNNVFLLIYADFFFFFSFNHHALFYKIRSKANSLPWLFLCDITQALATPCAPPSFEFE